MEKIAVLLLNLGGPDSLDSIKPFLQNLFLDKNIIKLPLQPLLARVIASSRSKKVRDRYGAIGGKSPILEQTTAQANSVQQLLNQQDRNQFKVYIGMRYWHPYISDTVKKITEDKPDKLVVLPLFPHYSKTTTGSCFIEVRKAIEQLKPGFKIDFVKSWCDNKLYIDSLNEVIAEGLENFTEASRRETYILFSAHSLPQQVIDEGDPYLSELQTTVSKVMEKAGSYRHSLALQSRSGPVKWMEPGTDTEIVRLGSDGVKNLLIVPLSFVSDHIETLYEIDIMFKEIATASGIENFIRTPSLNSRPSFIAALKDIVERSGIG